MREGIVMNIKIVISNSEAQKLAKECGLSFVQSDSFKIKGIEVSEINKIGYISRETIKSIRKRLVLYA